MCLMVGHMLCIIVRRTIKAALQVKVCIDGLSLSKNQHRMIYFGVAE